MKHRVRLILWKAEEARRRAELLRAAGYKVDHEIPSGPEFLRDLREHPPTAVVIDLDRLPSHGRDVGLGVRQSKATRHTPIVFVGGEPEKVARIKGLLPDASFISWSNIRSALKRAIAHPPADPVRPDSLLAGYSGTPLPKKLGIKENSVVGLAGAPDGFRKTLGELPAGAKLQQLGRFDSAHRTQKPCDVILWFVDSRKELQRGVNGMAARMGGHAGPPPQRLWIMWPKKASGAQADVAQLDVREAGLAAGLVDFKICAVDATWSGLAFARRKTK